jgi:hypothetical protein
MNTTNTTAGAKPPTVTEAQKRSIACPRCGAGKGKPCKGSRIPGPNTFGGGWGGPPALDTAHRERRAAFLARDAKRTAHAALVVALRAFTASAGHNVHSIDTRTMLDELRAALTAYEATGDHNHDGKPIATGAPCPGGDCIVAEARAALARFVGLTLSADVVAPRPGYGYTPAIVGDITETPPRVMCVWPDGSSTWIDRGHVMLRRDYTGMMCGTRVRVRIVEPKTYAHGCAEALNGLPGTVEKFGNAGEVLVAFDKPAPTWWTHQTPATGFWFPHSDLVTVGPTQCASCGQDGLPFARDGHPMPHVTPDGKQCDGGPLPPCGAMRCFCTHHAAGAPHTDACNTNEEG